MEFMHVLLQRPEHSQRHFSCPDKIIDRQLLLSLATLCIRFTRRLLIVGALPISLICWLGDGDLCLVSLIRFENSTKLVAGNQEMLGL
jgi:hypothetical protein